MPRVKATVKKKQSSRKDDRAEIRKRAAEIRDLLNEHQPNAGVRLLDDGSTVYDGPCLDTGIPALNMLLVGREDGGFPRGRIIEIRGKAATSKTGTAMRTAAIAQQNGEVVALVDAEHALQRSFVRSLGVRTSEMLYSQPENGETGLRLVRNIVRTESAALVIVDSIAALMPELEESDDHNDARPGTHASMMSRWCRRIQSSMKDDGAAVIFINQLRTNPMVMYGSKDTSPGGQSMEYYASIRLDIRRIKTHVKKKGKKTIPLGFRILLKTIKNRFAPPFQELELDVMYGKGVQVVQKKKEKDLEEVADDDE